MGYQATVALLQAARTLSAESMNAVAEAIEIAPKEMSTREWRYPNQVAVNSARQELKRRA